MPRKTTKIQPQTAEQVTDTPATKPLTDADILPKFPANWRDLTPDELWQVLDDIWLNRSVRMSAEQLFPIVAARAELDRNGRLSMATVAPLQKLMRDLPKHLIWQRNHGQRPKLVQP